MWQDTTRSELMHKRTAAIIGVAGALLAASAFLYSGGLGGPPEKKDRPKGPDLPKPFATPSVVKHPKVVGWPEGKKPTAPPGFEVTLFAGGLDSPRWIYVLPDGDVLVVESRTEKKDARSANRITLFRDGDGDGKPEKKTVFLAGLNQPHGMLLLGETFYVANTDAVLRFPYKAGQTKIEGKGQKVMDLPAGGHNNHWTRNLLAAPDGKKVYVSVGSATNVDEEGIDAKDKRRAAILELEPEGGKWRVFASGLRNPCGMDWALGTNTLWTVVNERDELGDDLVPDFFTSVKDGGFYGWPYSYFGRHEDPRQKGKRPDLVAKAIVPDMAVGSHTASLGLVFYRDKAFPERYRGGAFIGQRGSWNRSEFAGYRVAFVPFSDGKPAGKLEDFLTGFIKNDSEVYGRPVGVAVAKDGALLVADDSDNRVWRVAAVKK